MVLITAGILALHLQVKWEPKTDLLPPSFVKAAQFLLDHGMPDPRGWELMAFSADFTPFSNTFWSRSQGVGWVSPDFLANGQGVINSFGLSIKPKSIGPRALYSSIVPRLRDNMLPNHEKYIPFGGPDSVSLMLLAIHGEEVLVSKTLDLLEVSHSHHKDVIAFEALQTFFNSRFEQAVVAFQHEQDSLALRLFRATIDDSVDFEAIAPSIMDKWHAQNLRDGQLKRPLFPHVADAWPLKRDLERRRSDRRSAPVNPSSIASLPIAVQVPILIDQLDQMGSSLDKQTRFGSFRANPSAERLYELGKPAVPQLLQALKSDDRLTRLEPITFSARPSYSVVSVKRVIQDLLCELAWNAPYRNASDEQLEAYWQKYLDKSDSWRAYDLMSREPTDAELGEISSALLQDDAHPEYHFYFGGQDYRHPRHISVRPGLRAAKEYTNPSISELLYKRIAKALPTSLNKSSTNGDSLALDLAMYSYYWDSKQSLPALRLATNRFLTVLPSLGAEFNSWSYRNFDLVLDARKALGDQSYIHDQQVYADLLMARSANQDPGACQYFINRIDDPNVQPLARKLLFDPGSGYQLQHYFSLKPMDLAILGSPIVLLPEGKAMAAKLLDDRSALLEDQIIASYGPNFVRDEGGQYVQVAKSRYDRLRPCDLMARAIWRIKGCPNFDLAWPQNKRDHTLPSIRRFFEQLNATNLDYRYMWATGTVN